MHFMMDAVGELDLREARVNERGRGSEQYPPGMLLGLLVYSYATGVFSSRQIERSTRENVAVRLLCADTHPDHDTICALRRRNEELLSRSFAAVLEMAARCGVFKVGGITVAIDGTKVLANASKHSAVSYERAGEAMRQLDLEVAELLKKAGQADSNAARRRPDYSRRGATAAGAKGQAGKSAGGDRGAGAYTCPGGDGRISEQSCRAAGAAQAGKEAPWQRSPAAAADARPEGSIQFHRPGKSDYEGWQRQSF